VHELRKDPIMSRWVAVMRDSLRPEDYDRQTACITKSDCFFCASSDHPIVEVPAGIPDYPEWSLKVIRSKVPILSSDGTLGRRGKGIYDVMNSFGADEAIIESPSHDMQPEDMGPGLIRKIIGLQRERILALEADEKVRYVLVSRNVIKGGNLYVHPHSRLIASPVIPNRIKAELDGAKNYYSYKERCIYCDIMQEELRDGSRIIMESEHFVAFCPYAPRFSFEFWIMPKRHSCEFKQITDVEADDLSVLFSSLLRKMRSVLGEPSWSYVVHSAPNRIPRRNYWHTLGDDYHWHIEVMPRLRRLSGVELGSGFYVVETSPEDAAKYLKEG